MGTNPNAGFRERGERSKRDKCSASRKVKRGGAAIIYCCPSRQAFAFLQRAKYKLENPLSENEDRCRGLAVKQSNARNRKCWLSDIALSLMHSRNCLTNIKFTTCAVKMPQLFLLI